MKGTARTQVIQFLVTQAALSEDVKATKVGKLAEMIKESTGHDAPNSTIYKIRADLGWPSLATKDRPIQDTRIKKLEDTLAFVINLLNIDLPDRLK
jgi:hypothetical protein